MTEPTGGGFSEPSFLEEFEALLDAGRSEAALTLLIQTLPGISGARMNRKEKLNHLLFAPRLLQAAGLGKHGPQKLQRKLQAVRSLLETHPIPHRACFVDFGAGAHDPLALSLGLYANGFEQTIANDFLPVRNPRYSALSMYDILAGMTMSPQPYLLPGGDAESLLARIADFDAEAFQAGDFEGGIAPLGDRIGFRSCDIVEAGIAPASVSLLVSFAVFEHVMDIGAVAGYLHDITAPGGVGFHYIDLADHRVYRHDGAFHEFTFLTEEKGPPNLNRLRMSEQVAAFEAAGFEILSARGRRVEVPETLRAAYQPKWAAMSEEDQTTRALHLAVRRPEQV